MRPPVFNGLTLMVSLSRFGGLTVRPWAISFFSILLAPAHEPDIVVDDGRWPDGQPGGVRHIEFLELDLLRPDLFQEILEDGDGQEFAGATPISKTERRKPRIVADGMRLAIDNAKNSAECAVRHVGVPPPSLTGNEAFSNGHLANPIALAVSLPT